MPALPQYSPSSLKTLRDCARRFEYQYVLRIPQFDETSVALEIGKAYQDTLELGIGPAKLRYASLTPEDWKKIEQMAYVIESNPNYLTPVKKSSWNVEFNVTTKSGINVRGFYDRLDIMLDGTVEVKEFKTAAAKWPEDKFHSEFQGLIYPWSQWKLTGKIPNMMYLVVTKQVTPQVQIRNLKFTQQQMEEVERVIDDYDAFVEKGIFEANPTFNCRWCPYRLICPQSKYQA